MPQKREFLKKYIGDKPFYMAVLALITPIIIQNSISNFVNLLDNLMVGSVGEAQMNGVSISNQLMFIYNLCVFGGMSGAGIYAAQFYGAKDENGLRHAFRYSLLTGLVISLVGVVVFASFEESLLKLWIHPDKTGTAEHIAEEIEKGRASLAAGKEYLSVMLFGLLPFALTNAYASILRVTGETRLPMFASIVSVVTNLLLNSLFIFILGLAAKGAAIATVIARYVEFAIILTVSYRRLHKDGSYSFLRGALRHFAIPRPLLKSIFVRGLPLLLNEFLWSTGMALLNQQYSRRGLDVVNALTITSTLTNLFNVVFISMGTASSVLVGRALGANDIPDAKDKARKIIVFEEMVCVATCLMLVAVSPWLPLVYTKSSPEAKHLASRLIRVSALMLPLNGFSHCTYFTLRSGGKTFITFLFDSVYTLVIPVPLAYVLARFTGMHVVPMYALVSGMEIIKVTLGYCLLKKGVWIHNIVTQRE